MANSKEGVYSFDNNVNARYVLGQPGKNNLLVIGVNPSTATPEKPDPTIRKVINISQANGYDGWIMVNLYPQRNPNPEKMVPKGMTPNQQLVTENLEQIKSICENYKIENVWCAWGNAIDTFGKDSFLHKSRDEIKELLKKRGVTFYHYKDMTNAGNPRHPNPYIPFDDNDDNELIPECPKLKKTALYGAILGDIIGSPFEFSEIRQKSKDFELFSDKSKFTDDTVMTIAVADAILRTGGAKDGRILFKNVAKAMLYYGKKYPHAGYGGGFRRWLKSDNPKPYNSFGNGSAMRVSAAGWIFNSMFDTRECARMTARPTHNHPEGVKGAMAVASAIFLARKGSSKEEIKNYIDYEFYYDLSRSLEDVRENCVFDETCPVSVPEAIIAFLESENFEDAIRNAVSLGGDTDTQAAIAGSIAEAFYGVPENLIQKCREYLPQEFLDVIDKFNFGKGYLLDDLENDSLEEKIAEFNKNPSEKNSQKVKEEILDMLKKATKLKMNCLDFFRFLK